ncbi:MAG: magnesium/cobalt efflux protein [Gammaproteobacteria bacterium RIFCSPLOWO2_02_FULL_52_10]|nr:MAG: magnesium/cobalt efflux protein [Gammaproteobacteria bacterium RIFCSPLOWO2_02_FULL_52_10]
MGKDQPASGSAWFKQVKKLFSRAPVDRQDLIEILRESENRNLLDHDVLIMIEGALYVSDLRVSDVMVPKIQMTAIQYNASLVDIIRTVVDSGHSRFPVIGEDTNQILGILLAKDLLSYYANPDNRGSDLKDIMRPAVFIPESKRLNVLLRDFRVKHNHMAIVVDEYGVTGLITIEDVLEEIVGEIEDETDIDEEVNITPHGKNRYTVKAITPIDEFNETFNTELDTEEYDTIGGLIIEACGHLPKRGETLDFAGFNVKVLKSDKRRIQLLRFTRGAQENSP